MTTDADLTDRERAVVNAFQGGFPVADDPFEVAAAAMRDNGIEITATELLETIRDLDERGVLSRFGPLVNAQEIGGAATLVAMHAPEDRFDAVRFGHGNDEPDVQVRVFALVVVRDLAAGVDGLDDFVEPVLGGVHRDKRRRAADLLGVHQRAES